MRVGFLVWNKFQVGHFVEIAKQFLEPDFIFVNRDVRACNSINLEWLTNYGSFTRFVRETNLASLDGQYDVILTQFTPSLNTPWQKTKLIMCQYSMAKPRTAFNARWQTADLGLVYGKYSTHKIEGMCRTSEIGNSRFDPYFENRLNQNIMSHIRGKLDPAKKTVLFLPTWGDLRSQSIFKQNLDDLTTKFNIIYKPHHLTPLRDSDETADLGTNTINANQFDDILDTGPYMMKVADVVVSDMSGAVFDAIYCKKPVVLIGLGHNYENHKKADPESVEIARSNEIGPLATTSKQLIDGIETMLVQNHPYTDVNAALTKECFTQQGGCAKLAKNALDALLSSEKEEPYQRSDEQAKTRAALLNKGYRGALKRASETKNSKKKTVLRASTRWMMKTVLRASIRWILNTLQLREALKTIEKWVRQRGHKKLVDTLSTFKLFYFAIITRQLRIEANIVQVGLEVEKWLAYPPKKRRIRLYHFYCAASTLRLSRMVWRQIHSQLLEYSKSGEISQPEKRTLLRDLGLLQDAISACNENSAARKDFLSVVELIEPLSDPLRYAIANESRNLGDQWVHQPDGKWKLLSECKGKIFELCLILGFTRVIRDSDDGMRVSMISVTRHLMDTLIADGWSILPRIQAGYKGSVPISGRYPSATWHTRDTGVPHQLHLKVGSLNSHIIIDNRGYSGWSSMATKKLSDITTGVDLVDAERQFKVLQTLLVAKGKSKYKQSEEHLPDVGKYIFLPMQVITDTVAKLSHIDGLTLLKILSDWAPSSRYKIIVKRHPLCHSRKVAEALKSQAQAGKIILSKASIHDLIGGADCVVTVNSGVGAEALVHLKPVITTGGSDYAAATTLVKTKEDLIAALNAIPDGCVDENEVKRFLWHYSKRYQIEPSRDPRSVSARVRELLSSGVFA